MAKHSVVEEEAGSGTLLENFIESLVMKKKYLSEICRNRSGHPLVKTIIIGRDEIINSAFTVNGGKDRICDIAT